jgi:hypothetical protein
MTDDFYSSLDKVAKIVKITDYLEVIKDLLLGHYWHLIEQDLFKDIDIDNLRINSLYTKYSDQLVKYKERGRHRHSFPKNILLCNIDNIKIVDKLIELGSDDVFGMCARAFIENGDTRLDKFYFNNISKIEKKWSFEQILLNRPNILEKYIEPDLGIFLALLLYKHYDLCEKIVYDIKDTIDKDLLWFYLILRVRYINDSKQVELLSKLKIDNLDIFLTILEGDTELFPARLRKDRKLFNKIYKKRIYPDNLEYHPMYRQYMSLYLKYIVEKDYMDVLDYMLEIENTLVKSATKI